MRKSLAMVSVLSVLALSGCATAISGTVRTSEVSGTVSHQPVTSNLNVKSTRVTGQAKVGSAQEALGRNLAVRNALAAAQADVLVAPTYTLQVDGTVLTVTVTGYPATYAEFRNATPADLALLSTAPSARAEAATIDAAAATPAKKSGLLGVLMGAFVLIALVASGY